jgi:multiple sugar transport system substrate-binding protein
MRRVPYVLLAIAVLSLSACSRLTNGADPNTIGGTVTLWYLEDPDHTFIDSVKAGFEAKYPGTTVELTEQPEDGFVTKVDTALLAHQPPDVAFIYEPRWMKGGAVMPLDDVIEENDIDTSNMNAVALSECEYEGSLYCLGSLTGSVMLIYNKDLFDQAGVAYPSADEPMTIDEYSSMARQLHAGLDGVWGAAAGAPFTWAGRTTHFSNDGRRIQGVVDDSATLHMYDVLTGLMRDKVSPTASESELVLPADMLGAGSVAMAITDMEYAAKSLEQGGYRWGAAPPPVEQAGDPSFVFVGTDKYGAFADAANPATAKALVAFIATEGNRIRAEQTDQPPLDASMLQSWAGADTARQEVVKVLSTSTEPGLFVPGFWEVTAGLLDIYAQAGAGEVDARQAIQGEAGFLQEKLDREWSTWEGIN